MKRFYFMLAIWAARRVYPDLFDHIGDLVAEAEGLPNMSDGEARRSWVQSRVSGDTEAWIVNLLIELVVAGAKK